MMLPNMISDTLILLELVFCMAIPICSEFMFCSLQRVSFGTGYRPALFARVLAQRARWITSAMVYQTPKNEAAAMMLPKNTKLFPQLLSKFGIEI